MGGRGSSSGVSVKGVKYGTEFTTVHKISNIKFVKFNHGSAKTPMETMTHGRVYVTVNNKNELKSITYYGKGNKRKKQIDLTGTHNGLKAPHVHIGYEHDEKGTRKLSPKEQKMVDFAVKVWDNKLKAK